MRKRTAVLVLLTLLALLVLGAFPAPADPQVCGLVRVTVLGDPRDVPGLPYCDSCPWGIGQGPNTIAVWPVKVESYECAKDF